MKKGFTLIELLVVVAIIGVISAIGMVTYNGYLNKNKAVMLVSQHKMIVNYITMKLNECIFGAEYIYTSKYGETVQTNCNEYFSNFETYLPSVPDIFIDQFDRDNGYTNLYNSFHRSGKGDCSGRFENSVVKQLGIAMSTQAEIAAGWFMANTTGFSFIGKVSYDYKFDKSYKWCPEGFKGILVVTNLSTELCQEYDYFMGNKYTPDENRAVTCIPLE